MTILVMCKNPECGELFDAPAEAAGRSFRCPVCGTQQEVSGNGKTAAPTTKPSEPAPARSQLPLDAQAATPAPPRPPAAAKPPRPPVQPTPADLDDEEELDLKPVEFVPRPSKAEDKALHDALIRDDAKAKALPQNGARKPPKSQAQPPGNGWDAPADHSEHEPLSDQALPPIDNVVSSLLAEDLVKLSEARQVGVGGELEGKISTTVIFTIALAGMVGGLIIGGVSFPGVAIIACYVGAGIGWVAGFIFAFLLVLSPLKAESQKVRCAVCLNSFPADTEHCSWCGSSLNVGQTDPLISDCLHAGRYARSNVEGVLAMSLVAMFSYFAIAGLLELVRAYPHEVGPYRAAVWTLCAMLAFIVFGYWMQYFLSAIYTTLLGRDRAPGPPRPLTGAGFVAALKGIGAAALFIVPLVLFPLLPLSLLLMVVERQNGFDVRRLIFLLRRYARDYAILWMMLLLWTAALVLGVAIVLAMFQVIELPAGITGASEKVLSMTISGISFALLGVVVALFGLAICRCIGMFGRHNAAAMFPHIVLFLRPHQHGGQG